MIKYAISCITLLLLCGCTATSRPPVEGEPPKGVIKVLTQEKINTYLDTRTISDYQGNPRLRQIYMINNYKEPIRINPSFISSSRTINVINCDAPLWAEFERIYFSQHYAQGDVMLKSTDIAQWKPFSKNSVIGVVANIICKISPERLKPQPPRDTREEEILKNIDADDVTYFSNQLKNKAIQPNN